MLDGGTGDLIACLVVVVSTLDAGEYRDVSETYQPTNAGASRFSIGVHRRLSAANILGVLVVSDWPRILAADKRR